MTRECIEVRTAAAVAVACAVGAAAAVAVAHRERTYRAERDRTAWVEGYAAGVARRARLRVVTGRP